MDGVQSEICRLCLTTERALFSVKDVRWAFYIITDTPEMECLHKEHVCWECKAILLRLIRFKRQAHQAKQILEECHSKEPQAITSIGKGLSGLTRYTKVYYDVQLKFDDICDSKLRDGDTKTWFDTSILVEPKSEPESDEGVPSDCEVWADPAYYPDAREEEKDEVKPEKIEVEVFVDTVKTKNGKGISRKSKKRTVKPEMSGSTEKKSSSKEIMQAFSATDRDLSDFRKVALANLRMYSLKCETCFVGFKAEDKLIKHNRRFHSEAAGAHACDACDCRFARASTLSRHRAAHRTLYRCARAACRYVSNTVRGVRMHYARMHRAKAKRTDVPLTHRCEHCKMEFRSYGDMLTHRKTHTSGPYECDNCGKTFDCRTKILQHMRKYELKFVCDVCGKGCARKTQLQMHTLAHLDPSHRSHECDVCKKRFNDKYKLVVHSRLHTGERPFQCQACGKRFTSREQMKMHFKKHHAEGGYVKSANVKPRTKSLYRNRVVFPGQEANRLLTNEAKVKHSKIDLDDFECKICNKKLRCLKSLQTHSYLVHKFPKKGMLKCSECEKTFRFNSQLQLHRMSHTGEKRFQCTICGSRYYTNSQLRIHTTGHSNERPYKCDVCDMTFKYSANLYTHKFIHTGEKPHQCSICGARFAMKGNLTGHMRTHSDSKPFECDLCGRKFPWRRNLKNHYKTHDKEQRILEPQT